MVATADKYDILSVSLQNLSVGKDRSCCRSSYGAARLVEGVASLYSGNSLVSFPDPAFKLDKGLAHFARNLGLADSALPEIWRTNQIAFTC